VSAQIIITMKTATTNELFKTYDLGLASALITDTFKLLKLVKDNPKKILFCFQNDLGIEQAVEDYFSCNFQVDAQTYWNNIKSLKNRLYSSDYSSVAKRGGDTYD